MYKDNVCYEQSAYGCKDQYGVFYPIWYNRTTLFESKNNDIIPRMLRAVTPRLMNTAKKVLIQPSRMNTIQPNKINMTKIYRADDYMVS